MRCNPYAKESQGYNFGFWESVIAQTYDPEDEDEIDESTSITIEYKQSPLKPTADSLKPQNNFTAGTGIGKKQGGGRKQSPTSTSTQATTAPEYKRVGDNPFKPVMTRSMEKQLEAIESQLGMNALKDAMAKSLRSQLDEIELMREFFQQKIGEGEFDWDKFKEKKLRERTEEALKEQGITN